MTAIADEQPLVAHDMTEMRRASLAQLASDHGDDESEAVDEVMRRFVKTRSDVEAFLYADTVQSLQAMRDRGLVVGALTNGNADVRLHDAVSRLFDFSIGAAEAGAAKPAASPFWMTAHAVGCHPAEIVHIGDDVITDLLGALKAGFRAILVSRPDQGPRKPQQIEALRAIKADPGRWREVASLEEAVTVVAEWQAVDVPMA
mmetsp:Transcript_42468/g.111784  ORF Transcript_42468/g.111784 Transcript_42468/m.111784 type:complete len:202 (-) Transcript_42468:403-1008(-)